jgi:hypothetical protein
LSSAPQRGNLSIPNKLPLLIISHFQPFFKQYRSSVRPWVKSVPAGLALRGSAAALERAAS